MMENLNYCRKYKCTLAELNDATARLAESTKEKYNATKAVLAAKAGVTKSCDAKPANDSDHEQSDNQCADSKKVLADAWMSYKEGEL